MRVLAFLVLLVSATVSDARAQAPSELSATEIDAIHACMTQGWRTVRLSNPTTVRLRISVDASGALIGRPVVLEPTGAAAIDADISIAAALAAVSTCTPIPVAEARTEPFSMTLNFDSASVRPPSQTLEDVERLVKAANNRGLVLARAMTPAEMREARAINAHVIGQCWRRPMLTPSVKVVMRATYNPDGTLGAPVQVLSAVGDAASERPIAAVVDRARAAVEACSPVPVALTRDRPFTVLITINSRPIQNVN